jgi:hypothetical protein
VLELVQLRLVLDQIEDAVDRRTGALRVVLGCRSGHEPDEDGVVGKDERRHSEDAEPVDDVEVLRFEGLVRLATVQRFGDLVHVQAERTSDRVECCCVAQVESVLVASPEHLGVEGGEAFRPAVAHDEGIRDGHQVASVALVLEDRRFPFWHMWLVEREGQPPDVPVGSGFEAGDDMQMDIARKGAAIVKGQAELLLCNKPLLPVLESQLSALMEQVYRDLQDVL